MASAISFDKPSFLVDSRNRDEGSIEDCNICVDLPANNKFNQISISSVVIPKSYYNVTDGRRPGEIVGRILGIDDGTKANGFQPVAGSNGIPTRPLGGYAHNEFSLLEGTSSSGGVLISIPLASYNQCNFPEIMSNLLTNNSVNGWTYDVSYPNFLWEKDTKKWTFSVSGNGTNSAALYFPIVDPIDKPVGCGTRNKLQPVRSTEIMGMNASLNNGQRVFDSNGKLVSDFQVDFELTKYITIKSDICLDQGNQTSDNAILGTIPVIDVEDGAVINYELQQLEDESKYLANNRKNQYSFSLYDDHDEPLNLNGINWFIKLFVYEYNPFFEVAINDIKIRQLALANQSLLANRQVNQPPSIE